MLNVLGLLERPTCGEYRVGVLNTGHLNERSLTALRGAHFGFVFQSSHLLADRTAQENVELPLLYRRMSRRTRGALAGEALERVGLSHRRQALPGTLSGGERQRVTIARALAQRPHVLLCDEPTGALDRANSQVVLDLLHRLNQDGLTVVIVTHDESITEELPRRLRLDDGFVTEERRTS
jgi:putative ABC transport system ATP-binding protein